MMERIRREVAPTGERVLVGGSGSIREGASKTQCKKVGEKKGCVVKRQQFERGQKKKKKAARRECSLQKNARRIIRVTAVEWF